MIQFKKLRKSYDATPALVDLDFSVKKGEILGFLGPNGAGKTTTLKIATGSLNPDSGDVLYDNKSIRKYKSLVLKQLGYLPENNPLYENLRVDEFLQFFGKVKDASAEELSKLVSLCGLTDVASKKIEQLSKGYKQRVGIAKALIGDPKYILLDEPTTGLDPNQKQDILDLIKELAEDKTIIFSSHILSEVTDIAGKVAIIHKGQVVSFGSTQALLNQTQGIKQIEIIANTNKKQLQELISQDFKQTLQIKKFEKQDKTFNVFVLEVNDELKPEDLFKKLVAEKVIMQKFNPVTNNLADIFKELTK